MITMMTAKQTAGSLLACQRPTPITSKSKTLRMAASGLPGVLENFVYTLKIRALATGAEQVNLDAEAGDDAESAQAMGWSERYHYAWVVGGFERSGDVDT